MLAIVEGPERDFAGDGQIESAEAAAILNRVGKPGKFARGYARSSLENIRQLDNYIRSKRQTLKAMKEMKRSPAMLSRAGGLALPVLRVNSQRISAF